jgi:hypothetical protein
MQCYVSNELLCSVTSLKDISYNMEQPFLLLAASFGNIFCLLVLASASSEAHSQYVVLPM